MKPVIAHSMLNWLPVTMNWVYNQMTSQNRFRSIVLTNAILKECLFPTENVYTIEGSAFARVIHYLRKLGIRAYPQSFSRAIHESGAKLLHSHFANRGWFDLDLAKRHGLKHIVTFYGYDVNMLPTSQPKWKRRYGRLFRQADLFLCEGGFMAEAVVKLGCPREKVKVQHLGVDLSRIRFEPRIFKRGETLRILIAGTFKEKKGIPDALRAVGMFRSRYPDVKVTLVGESTGMPAEEAEKERILSVISEYGLDNVVARLGFLPPDRLMELGYSHHVFLSPSVVAADGDTEGGAPVTIIEMSASGMPIVSTLHCDIPEVVVDGRTGFLAREHDPEGLAARLDALIGDEENFARMAAAAREHISREYDIEKTALSLMDVYARMAESR